MNRIRTRKSQGESFDRDWQSSAAFELSLVNGGTFTRCEDERSPTATFAPLHYERNYAYPLIVWLHGPGDNEGQLKRIMPLVSMRNYVAIAPRGTVACEGQPNAFDWSQSKSDIDAAEQRILESVAAARERFHLAADRLFLAGYDRGGTMALRLALRQPRMFAGVLSLAGRFPDGHAPLSQLVEARRLSIFLACNRAAQRYPSAAVCQDLRLVHSAGMSIMLREYPGPDGLLPQMLADMDRWLMEQITGGNAADAPASAASQPGSR